MRKVLLFALAVLCPYLVSFSSFKGSSLIVAWEGITQDSLSPVSDVFAERRYQQHKQPWTGDKSLLNPLVTNSAISPQQLVEDVLIAGGCFEVSNITFSGSNVARGTFSNAMPSIGMEEGLILATGDIIQAAGPNSGPNSGSDLAAPSDPDLAALIDVSTFSIYDAAILEFDFVPTTDQISFEYVFGSEEYCTYVGSAYNDVFGFFISGPGINGPYSNNAENIALLPGTTMPVSINNVNHISNTNYYVSNLLSQELTDCEESPLGIEPALGNCEYDGFTVVLTAVASVIPCETYHIKLAIADVGDGFLDSGVFFKANSFVAGGQAAVSAVSPIPGTNKVYENCSVGYFEFVRTIDDNSEPLNINIQVGGTATPGIDYEALPDVITIPAGENSVQIPVTAFEDNLVEGDETIVVALSSPCSCSMTEEVLVLSDLPPLEVDLPSELTVCAGESVSLEALPSGGITIPLIGEYSFLWNDGTEGAVFSGTFYESQQLSVTLTDFCGQTAMASTSVNVVELSAALSGGGLLCSEEDSVEVIVDITGSDPGPWSISYEAGGTLHAINGIEEVPYTFWVSEQTTYTLLQVTGAICSVSGTGEATVLMNPTPPVAEAESPVVLPCSESEVTLNGSASSSGSAYTYMWTTNDGQLVSGENTPTPVVAAPGLYQLLVTHIVSGCTDRKEVEVVQQSIDGFSFELIAPNCPGDESAIVFEEVTGGTPPYLYSIDGGQSFSTHPYFQNLPEGNYHLVLLDAEDCSLEADTFVPAPQEILLTTDPATVFLDYGDEAPLHFITNLTEEELVEVQWFPAEGLSCVDCWDPMASPEKTTEYTVRVKSVDGCEMEAKMLVIVEMDRAIYAPNAFSPDGNGLNDEFLLFANLKRVAQIRRLLIYDRWSNLVFMRESFPANDPAYAWDGNFRSQPLKPGVFVWFAEVEYLDGRVELLKGDVVLIR